MPWARSLRAVASFAILFTLLLPRDAHAQVRQVVLPNGTMLEFQTEDGLPLPYRSDEIEILNIGITVPGGFQACAPPDSLTFSWMVQARLKASGRFQVTVTSPLDDSVSTGFEASGPGEMRETFKDFCKR